jgi:hypothetical protein
MRMRTTAACSILLTMSVSVASIDAQVRAARRTAVVKGEERRGVPVRGSGTVVRGEDGYAAAGRRGAVVRGDEGYAAVGRRGAVVRGENGYAAAGRRGAVVSGEDGYAAVGRRGVVVGNRYESYEAWRTVAGIGSAIAVGTMLARPPRAAVTVRSGGATYWYDSGTYYTRVISNGSMVYQVVAPPAGIVISTLPAGCRSVRIGNVAYSQCGRTYYQRVSSGYRVVIL